jgi:hypothetical protein
VAGILLLPCVGVVMVLGLSSREGPDEVIV